jgi:hypothetical protein
MLILDQLISSCLNVAQSAYHTFFRDGTRGVTSCSAPAPTQRLNHALEGPAAPSRHMMKALLCQVLYHSHLDTDSVVRRLILLRVPGVKMLWRLMIPLVPTYQTVFP